MDRIRLLLLGLPLVLFCSDLLNLFTPNPPPPRSPDHHRPPPSDSSAADLSAPLDPQLRGPGYGTTVELKFCASCSFRSNAMTTKKMLETAFPGIDVILANYPPSLPKRLLGKVVPILQVGVVGIVMAGEQIFPRLGYVVPPPWYFSLRSNKFRAIASTWLLGNFVQSFLQSSGAFEVYCNGDLVFSKLREHRFPGELELRDLISMRLHGSSFGADM